MHRLARGALSVPLLLSVSEAFLVPFLALIKPCYTKALEWSSLVPGPEAKSSSEITNPTSFTISYQGSAVLSPQGISLGWSLGVSHAGFLPAAPKSLSGSCRLWQNSAPCNRRTEVYITGKQNSKTSPSPELENSILKVCMISHIYKIIWI